MNSTQGKEILVVRRKGALRDIFGYLLGFLIFGGCFLVFFIAHISGFVDRGEEIPLKALTVLFGCGMLFFLCATLRQTIGGTATFDAQNKTVTFKQIFSMTQTMPFDAIARIAPVVSKSAFLTRTGYCVVSKQDPIYAAPILSTFFRRGSAKLAAFESEIIPRIHEIVGLKTETFSGNPADAVAAGYIKDAHCYVKSYWTRLLFSCGFFVLCLLGALKLLRIDQEDALIVGGILTIASILGFSFSLLFGLKSVLFDTSRKRVTIVRGLLGRTKEYPYSSVESIAVISFYGNIFLQNNKALGIRFKGEKRPLQLTQKGKRSQEKIRLELQGIAGLLEKDPVNDVSYMQKRVNNNLL